MENQKQQLIRIHDFNCNNLFKLSLVFLWVLALSISSLVKSEETGFPGRNKNIIGPPIAGSGQLADLGLRQQNEPSCAVNPVNPAQVCCGFNDYRGIDIEQIGDSWQGLSCSRNAGQSWNSQLLPGHGADPDNNLNLEFAADPNLVAVPGGLFYNFIAADRGSVGGIYIQRFAWRNKEDGWPLIQVGGPELISKGTNGRFIDKPHMIGFLDDNSDQLIEMNWNNGSAAESRSLPAGNLGMAAAIFVGNDNNDGTKILYWSSDDWGKTWRHPTKLSESKGVNSGVNVAANGDKVCAVWRRFDDTNESSSILQACSTNRGKTFAKPKVLYEDLCPFDQTTLNGVSPSPKDIVSFRSNAFPVIAADGDKFYTFWSDRGFAAASNGQAGCNLRTAENGFNPSYGRIVFSETANSGKTWSKPKVVEDSQAGHQFMPAAFGANGEVVVSWIDSRDDLANHLDVDKQLIVDFWKEGEALYRHTTDIRSARLQSGGNTSFTPSKKISSYTRGMQRNSEGDIIGLRQMEFNLVNARLFQKGTAPFIGDYLSVTAKNYHQNADGKWLNSNSAPGLDSPTFHISWGDNRDVRGNAWGNADSEGFSEASPYTPVAMAGGGSETQTQTQASNSSPAVEEEADPSQQSCSMAAVKADRSRDQNIYSAALYPLASLRSPGALKITGQVQRAFPVYLENFSNQSRYFRLNIMNQPNDFSSCKGVASFRQYPETNNAGQCGEVSAIWVKVFAKSSAVRSVFVHSAIDITSPIGLQAEACGVNANGAPDPTQCEAVASVTLNEEPINQQVNLEQPDYDSLNNILTTELHNPDLLNPDLLNPDLLNLLIQNPDLLNPDLLNPDLLNPDLLNPDLLNPDLLNPDLLNPDLLNLVLLNPDLLNPDLLNPDLLNPDLLNPDLLNPDLLNRIIANPDLLNPDLLNPDLLNPDLLNPDLLNAVIEHSDIENPQIANSEMTGDAGNYYLDLTWQVKNDGNTTTGYVAQPYIAGPQEHTASQLIVSKPYLRQTTRDCLPVLESDNQVMVNIYNPPNQSPIIDPDPQDEATYGLASYWLAPGEVANITLRVFADNAANLHSSRGGLYVNSQACNSDGVCNNQPYVITTRTMDNTGPLLTPDILNDIPQVEATGPEGAVVEFDKPTAFDEGDQQAVAVDCDFESGATFPLGVTDNQCNAVDSVGNTSNLGFSVEVLDSNPPAISFALPQGVTLPLEAVAPLGVQLDYSSWISVSDLVDEQPTLTCTPAIGGWFGLGVTQLNCSATDASGNTSNASFSISVADNIAPTLTVPQAEIVVEANSMAGAAVSYTVSASDTVDPQVAINCSPESGSLFPLGITNTSCTATDASGNSISKSFIVNVSDTIAPDLSVPSMISQEATGPDGNLVTFSVIANDQVELGLVECIPASGSRFALGDTLVSCSASDSSNNLSQAYFTVSINDTSPPLINPPADISQEAQSAAGNLVNYELQVSDLVDTSPSLSCLPASGSLFSLGRTQVNCTATDNSGNSAQVSFAVIIADSSPPAIQVPDDFHVAAQSSSGALVEYQVTATDSVDDDVEIACIPASATQFSIGVTRVNCTATNDSGLSASDSFKVTVGVEIIWIKPTSDLTSAMIGPNFHFRWGYGVDGHLQDSADIIAKSKGKGTAPLIVQYMGANCDASNPQVVDLDAGKSSLRYSSSEWQLNWQTGQSTLNNLPLIAGCYELEIPRAAGGVSDYRRVLLEE